MKGYPVYRVWECDAFTHFETVVWAEFDNPEDARLCALGLVEAYKDQLEDRTIRYDRPPRAEWKGNRWQTEKNTGTRIN